MALDDPGPAESPFFTDSVRRSGFSLRNQFAEHMEFGLVKTRLTATEYDYYLALSMAVKDRLVRRWLRTQQTYWQQDARRVYYLSLEFLMGRLLANTLINMDYYQECREIIRADGLILEDLMEVEYDMGLTADWAGWQPVTWILWRPCGYPPAVTASATSSGSSVRRSATVTRSSSPTTGCIMAIPGKPSALS
jgi:hypothetical protein